jgi:hypothetical protein
MIHTRIKLSLCHVLFVSQFIVVIAEIDINSIWCANMMSSRYDVIPITKLLWY